MHEMQRIYTKQRKFIFFLLAAYALGWGFTPYSTVFAGLAVGSLFGLYNFWILVRRMEKFDRVLTDGKGRAGLGTTFRFASGVASVAIALALPEFIHLISTVIGLMIPYVLLLVERLMYYARHQL